MTGGVSGAGLGACALIPPTTGAGDALPTLMPVACWEDGVPARGGIFGGGVAVPA